MELLKEQGIKAIGYHGKMTTEQRTRNQERWMSDEIPVLVGTLAFGLGINKAAVRAVIHLALPKSIEQFYQEAGQSGARRIIRGLCFVVAQTRCGIAGAFYRAAERSAGSESGVGSVQHDQKICGVGELPASADLPAFWRESEVENV